MKIQNIQTYTVKRFSTNGVLRCLCGELPTGKTEKDIADTNDIVSTIKKVFKYDNNDLSSAIERANILGAFILPIGAGKYLEAANPILKGLKGRLMVARKYNNINSEIKQMISEIGETIDLKA